ncbi:MAG: hypothetical protein ACRDPW_04960, partial [Mycobacteriales bacterium]
LLNIFLEGNPPPVQAIIDSLEAEIYVNLAALAIVIGAVVMAYRAIIKGFGLADFLSRFVAMVVVSGLAVVFFNNVIPWIKWGNERVNEVTCTTVTALRNDPAGGNCDPNQGSTIVDDTAESIYNVLVFTPWANGMVGSLSSTNGEGDTAEQKKALALQMLDQQAFTWSQVKGADEDLIGRDVDTGGIGLNPFNGVNEALLAKAKEKVADRDKMVKEDWGAKLQPEVEDDGDPNTPLPEPGPLEEFNPDGAEEYSRVVMTNKGQTVWEMWSGGKAGERFAIAVMAVIAAFSFGGMLISITMAYLVLQIATVMFALVAPLAFLVALVPVYGMKVFLQWGELFLSTFIKRVAMAIFVALVLVLYELILDTDGVPWLLQMVLILAIASGAASYRKKLTSLSTLGFTGRAGGGSGLGSTTAKVSAVRNTWSERRDLGLLSRAIAAGRAGAHAGGSGVGGGTISHRGADQHAALRSSGRSGAPHGYAPHQTSGSSRGSYPVSGRDGRAGQDGLAGAPGRAAIGRGDNNGDSRRLAELEGRLDQLEGDVQYAGVGSGSRGGPGAGRGGSGRGGSGRGGGGGVYNPNNVVRGAATVSRSRQPRSGETGMGDGR